jgi:putative membrane protein
LKKILKFTLLFAFAIVLQNQFWQNFSFDNNVETIIKVSFILTVFELFLKPILKILLLPINILTLGLIRLVINTLGFYLATFLLADFSIQNISLSPQSIYGLAIPALNFSGFWAHLINTASTNIIVSFFKFILKSKPKDKK